MCPASQTSGGSDHGAVPAVYGARLVRRGSSTFLAPDIVERIVAGDHPAWLGTKRLLAMAPLPLDWAEQGRVLGMGDRAEAVSAVA